MCKIVMLLSLLALCFTAPAFAATNPHPFSLELCHSVRSVAHQAWQLNAYAVPPSISSIMVDATDGKTSAVREALARMNATDARHWRQLAMYLAATAGRSHTVDFLLDDGAKADGLALIPPYKATFYRAATKELAHAFTHELAKDTPYSGDTTGDTSGTNIVKWAQARGLMNNQAKPTTPALVQTIRCQDLATVKVLLRHGANSNIQTPTGPDSLIEAIFSGDTAIIRTLLDHGADPCLSDRYYTERGLNDTGHNVTVLGKYVGLPPALIKRLAYHKPPSAG